MISSPEERRAVQHATDLEPPLAAVEAQLAALGTALHRHDTAGLDQAAAALHVALGAAVDHFSRAARKGGVPPLLRQRLAVAGGQVAAQREALARATASLDRALDVLLPRAAPPGLYSAAGASERPGGHAGNLFA